MAPVADPLTFALPKGRIQEGELHDLRDVPATDIILPGQFGYPADFAG